MTIDAHQHTRRHQQTDTAQEMADLRLLNHALALVAKVIPPDFEERPSAYPRAWHDLQAMIDQQECGR